MFVGTMPNTLIIQGALDESCSMAIFDAALSELRKEGLQDPVLLDFSGCPLGNSTGIVAFLRFLEKSNTRFCYIKTPPWLVMQFSLITQYLDNKNFVESVQVPYVCEADDSEILRLLYIGKDIPIRESYDDFVLGPCFVNGKKFDPDITPGIFFSFIADHIASFRHLELKTG